MFNVLYINSLWIIWRLFHNVSFYSCFTSGDQNDVWSAFFVIVIFEGNIHMKPWTTSLVLEKDMELHSLRRALDDARSATATAQVWQCLIGGLPSCRRGILSKQPEFWFIRTKPPQPSLLLWLSKGSQEIYQNLPLHLAILETLAVPELIALW